MMVEIISKDDGGNVNIYHIFVFAEVSPMLFSQMLGWR